MNSEQIGHEFARGLVTIESMLEPDDEMVIVEDDQSRFDLHLRKGAFGMLDRKYKRLLTRRVAKVLRRTDKSRGRTKTGIKYSIDYTMQSGYPDTSYGDTHANEVMKADIYGIGRTWFSIVCGDDSVTIMSRRLLEELGGAATLKQKYAEFGMEVKVASRRNYLLTEFCSGLFYPKGDSFVLMPKPGTIISRLGTDRVDRNPKNQLAWLRGIMSTFAHFGQLDPLCHAMAQRLNTLLGGGKTIVNQFSEYSKRLGAAHTVGWEDSLLFYSEHYGVREDEVRDIITHIQHMELGKPLTHPSLRHIVEMSV
jgi:hypothetical protein